MTVGGHVGGGVLWSGWSLRLRAGVLGFEVVTAGDGEEPQLGARGGRSEIGPSRNVPPFSARAPRIALDPFHILKKSEAKSGIES